MRRIINIEPRQDLSQRLFKPNFLPKLKIAVDRKLVGCYLSKKNGFPGYCIYADLLGPWKPAKYGSSWVLAIYDGFFLDIPYINKISPLSRLKTNVQYLSNTVGK